MRLTTVFLFVMFLLASSQDFNVVYNTLDPMMDLSDPRVGLQSVNRGANHIGSGDGIVDALTVCLRFHVRFSFA